jgi:hypothetical protein
MAAQPLEINTRRMPESIAQKKSKTKSMAWRRARFASSRQKF